MSQFFSVLFKELKKCYKSKDVPVSAILLDNKNRVVAKAHNSRQKAYNFANHAEIKVINKIYKKTKTKNLSDFTLISTLKPCLMCITVIEEANIKNVKYYLENIKCDYSKLKYNVNLIKEGDDQEARLIEKELKDFFQKLR